MPKLTFTNFTKAISVFADILAIIYIVYNIKTISICNPVVSILVYSLIATVLFFFLPFLWGKMKTKAEKVMIIIIVVIISIVLIYCWNRISDKSNCVVPEIIKSNANTAKELPSSIPSPTKRVDTSKPKPIILKKLITKITKSIAFPELKPETTKNQIAQLPAINQTGKNIFNGGNGVYVAPVQWRYKCFK